jgi:hypothetical protein
MTASTPLPPSANLALRRGLRGERLALCGGLRGERLPGERLPITEALTLRRPVGLLFPSAVSGAERPRSRTVPALAHRDRSHNATPRTNPQAEEPKCRSQIVAPGR